MDFDLFKNLVKNREGERARRICTNCGGHNEDTARHCMHCGHIFQAIKAQIARRCPAGHTLDPNWTECPYCEENRASQAMASDSRGDSRTRTRVEGQEPNAGHDNTRGTRAGGAPDESAAPVPEGGRIVGVLITYSRRREGELFPIRQGKNFIGKASVVSGGAPCDVWFPDDRQMSDEHALILYRRGEYLIFDQQSTNGTFVNNKIVHFRGEELPNYAEIKTGSTVFTFIKAEAHAPQPVVEPDVIDELNRGPR